VEVSADTLTRKGKRGVRRHMFLTRVRTTPDEFFASSSTAGALRTCGTGPITPNLMRTTFATQTGSVSVLAFLHNIVMSLLRGGGYRSIRQGFEKFAYELKGMLALGDVTTAFCRTWSHF
jgi:hypothetical protein